MSDTLRYVTWWLQLQDSRRLIRGGPERRPAENNGEFSPWMPRIEEGGDFCNIDFRSHVVSGVERHINCFYPLAASGAFLWRRSGTRE